MPGALAALILKFHEGSVLCTTAIIVLTLSDGSGLLQPPSCKSCKMVFCQGTEMYFYNGLQDYTAKVYRMVETSKFSDAAIRLHQHVVKQHWNNSAVIGPDPGIRFNARIWRFLKSYLWFVPWSDSLAYAQAQKYWILANWYMSELGFADSATCREMAIACTDYLLSIQHPDGYWEYPNPEWKGRIATVEGNYGAMGLLETYMRTGQEQLLAGAEKWYDYSTEKIGFQKFDNMLAINYFGNVTTGMVPNNSASALRIYGQLFKASGDERYLEYCPGMVRWLNQVQLETGELPYAVAGPGQSEDMTRIHFLCHQYNAFQYLNLADYYRFTGDTAIVDVLKNLARFVATGITAEGACRYDCLHQTPEVTYYGVAAGAALRDASMSGWGDYHDLADRAYAKALSIQQPSGAFAYHSRQNYGYLSDQRSYPRYLSMVLYHLLLEAKWQGQREPQAATSQEQKQPELMVA
ncbi:MAG: hypothetical protein KDE54_06515 [Caldilineaceae bacterium]|nr:hypothetical protein [Caldilineaceae bacterium]